VHLGGFGIGRAYAAGRVFGYTKMHYRGLKKNHEWLLTAFALVNLYRHRKRLVLLGA
jgi:hypothetical protein